MTTPPGWYPDPRAEGQLRWWDGTVWTDHVSAPAVDAPVNDRQMVEAELAQLRAELVEARDLMLLQEVGLYNYSHLLDTSVAYKDVLKSLRTKFSAAIRSGTAVVGTKRWAINGSTKEGERMVRDLGKLLLKAYNAEVESVVKTLKPYRLDPSKLRLEKTRKTIARLGKSMSLQVTDSYHALRIQELELTADFQAKLEEEREHQREERARLKEEAAARKEFEAEQSHLEKELDHYNNAIVGLRARGNMEALERAREKIAELERALTGVIERAANVRAGYVYVISNLGVFGAGVVKIGMTRRLAPLERVRELGGASVPFRFDVHAMIFSDDAVQLETSLHQRFAARKLNLVNLRREFFYVSPREVERALVDLHGDIVSFTEDADALEWRQSQTIRRQRGLDPIPQVEATPA